MPIEMVRLQEEAYQPTTYTDDFQWTLSSISKFPFSAVLQTRLLMMNRKMILVLSFIYHLDTLPVGNLAVQFQYIPGSNCFVYTLFLLYLLLIMAGFPINVL